MGFSRAHDISGCDIAWLASDTRGRLAAFITAGEGPVPSGALDGPLDVRDVEAALLALPHRGPAELQVSPPDPSSFLALAERGLWVYDWQDIHRVRVDETDAYDVVATPTIPLALDDLPDELKRLATRVRLALAFADVSSVPASALRVRG